MEQFLGAGNEAMTVDTCSFRQKDRWKKKFKPHTANPGVIGKRLSDFLHEKSVKHISYPVNTLTDSVPELKPMPASPCGLVNLLGEEDGYDQCWSLSYWFLPDYLIHVLPSEQKSFVLLTCFHHERVDYFSFWVFFPQDADILVYS